MPLGGQVGAVPGPDLDPAVHAGGVQKLAVRGESNVSDLDVGVRITAHARRGGVGVVDVFGAVTERRRRAGSAAAGADGPAGATAAGAPGAAAAGATAAGPAAAGAAA